MTIDIAIPPTTYANLRAIGSLQTLAEIALKLYVRQLPPSQSLGLGNPAGRFNGPSKSFKFDIPASLSGKLPWGSAYVGEHLTAAVMGFAKALKLDAPPEPAPMPIKQPPEPVSIALLSEELAFLDTLPASRASVIGTAISSYSRTGKRPSLDGKLYDNIGQSASEFKVTLPEQVTRLVPSAYPSEYIRAAVRAYLREVRNA